MNPDTYITPIHLLCVTCREPIRATITTAQWVRVEWISNEGECQGCWKKRKEQRDGD